MPIMEIKFTVPGTPPSVNHYKMKDRRGHWYVTKEAEDFKRAVWASCRQRMVAKSYSVIVKVFLGKKQKGDVDNFAKVCLDSLVASGIIDTDAKVTELHLHKSRDRENPRTEVVIRSMDGRLNDGDVKRHTIARLNSFVDAVAGKHVTWKELTA